MDSGRSAFPSFFRAVIRSPLLYAIIGLWLILLGLEKARPCAFLHDDNATWFIGAYLQDYRVLTETGRVAEVNYYQHSGEPFLQEGQSAVLYPPIYLGEALAHFFSGDARWAIEWIAAIHFTIGLVGFYFWLRLGGVTAGLAALAGLAWVLNPFIVGMSASWIFASFVAAWLPWIFWSFDLLLVRPCARAAFFLSVTVGLLFLQGYVQLFVYSVSCLALYALFQFALRGETRRLVVFYYLIVSMLMFTMIALPLLLPMSYALNDSAMRENPVSPDSAAECCAPPGDIAGAQFCFFRTNLVFGASTAILYSPALLFVPVAVLRLFYGGGSARRRLIPLLVVAVLAIIFSTEWHAILLYLPFFDRFRWPFKFFILADFFLIALMAWTAASWTGFRLLGWKMNPTPAACLILVVLASVAISLDYHDEDCLSPTLLPSSTSPLPAAMDSRLGRAATFDDGICAQLTSYYFSHAHATYFAFPSLGGYNPLVGRETLVYALYLDFPNICMDPLTPDVQKDFENRSVRYWIIDTRSSQFQRAQKLPGLRQIDAAPYRVIFEDPQASPLVYTVAAPTVPLPMSYSGNSLLISLQGVTSPVAVSLGPTDGWWYRIDHGPWLQPVDQHDPLKLILPVDATGRQLEVSFFDPRFWDGLKWSACLLLPLGLLLILGHRLERKV